MNDSLTLTLDGYTGTATRNADGSVTIVVDLGFPIGQKSLNIPASDAAALEAFLAHTAPAA